MKNNEMSMKALSMNELEMISGGAVGELDDSTVTVLEVIGDIVDWFNSWW